MAVEDAADRAVFVDVDDFGVTATYSLANGGDVSIDGIFDDGYATIDLERAAGFDRSSSEPQFHCRSADLPAAAQQDAGDTLTVGGLTYCVVEFMPDGTGMTVLRLSES